MAQSLRTASGNPWARFPSGAELVAQTPADRDRVVDLVRGVSLLVVMFGHSFMALVTFTPAGAQLSNTLAQTPNLQIATWVLQIMPLFFAAGAWANALSYRDVTSYPIWLSGRARRLLRPVVPYVGFWMLISPLMLAWNREATLPLLRISTQLLWFLGAYLLVTALTPLLVRFSVRPLLATSCWLGAAALIDVGVLAGAPGELRLLNFVVVWALAGQTGLWLFSPVHRPSQRRAAMIVLSGLFINALLVRFGPWPVSLVGLPGEEISNMAPPSVVMAMHAVILSGLACLVYSRLTQLAARASVWRATALVNSAAMSLYLWHLVALILALLTLRVFALDLPGYSTQGWVGPRLFFWALFATFTVGLVWLMRPFEHLTLPWWDVPAKHSPTQSWSYRARATCSVGGVVLVAVALLALSVTGLVGFPFNSSTSYAGFNLTPGLCLGGVIMGMLVIRSSALGNARQGRSVSTTAPR